MLPVFRQTPAPRQPAAIEDGEVPCFLGPVDDLQDRSEAVHRLRGLQLRFGIATVRRQLRHLRRLLQHRQDDVRRAVPVLHVGRVNLDRGREPLHLHRGGALPALDSLARVVSRRAAHLCLWNRVDYVELNIINAN